MMRHWAWLFATMLALCLAFEPAQAQQALHDKAKLSLAQLFVEGTARIGPATGTTVASKGTGFFVGTDGYILTTAHLFASLKEANAVNTRISAKFAGTGTGTVDVFYVSELASLDLVLLRAIIDNEIAVPPSLLIGHSEDVDLSNPVLLTSGYDLTGYRKKTLEFNSTSSALANFAWTLDGKTNAGASGSPVYIDRDGVPLVVGVLKATARDDDELTLMIPIEYSFQLIGQFKMQELIEEVAQLKRKIGEASVEKPPPNDRVSHIEASVDEIKGSFSWTAEADDLTGSLNIWYNKIVSNGPQIEQITVAMQSNPYIADKNGNKSGLVRPGLYGRAIIVPRHSLTQDGRSGKFVLPNIRSKLTAVILESGETFQDQEPFRDINLKITTSGGVEFQTTLTLVPKFTWTYDTN